MGTAKARKAKDPIRKDADQLLARLDKAKREEDVKAAWAKCFDLEYDTTRDHDLYTEQVLFEFKLRRNFEQPAQRAATLAQLLYYVRRLKLDGTAKGIPSHFCLADKGTAVLGEVADWRDLYIDEHGRYDWDLAPSSPDPLLTAAVQAHERFASMRVYHLAQPEEAVFVIEQLGQLFSPQARLDFGDRKAITEDNFEDVYAYWNGVFGESVANGFKPSRYFVADIQKGRSRLDAADSKIYFHVGDGEDVKVKRVLARDHEHFWSLYDKVIDPAVMRGIVTKIDRLTEDVARRKQARVLHTAGIRAQGTRLHRARDRRTLVGRRPHAAVGHGGGHRQPAVPPAGRGAAALLPLDALPRRRRALFAPVSRRHRLPVRLPE